MRIRSFLRAGASIAVVASMLAPLVVHADSAGVSWSSLGNDPGRTFYNGAETKITRSSIAGLVPKWRYTTTEPVTASPAVADVQGNRVVFDGAYDGTFFALDADTGVPIWTTCLAALSHLPVPDENGEFPESPVSAPPPVCDPQVPFPPPGNPDNPTDYGVIVASPAVASVDTPDGPKQLVFDAANATMFAMEAATGRVVWQFAGGYTDPTYNIEASPLIVGNQVIFGIDCNQHCEKGGGLYSVDAGDGHLNWFFDPASGTSFVPAPNEPMYRYDPTLHPSPPARTCGGIWASTSIDVSLGLVYTDTSNCDTASSPYFEAVFALHLADGSPAWTFTPRQIDSRDMDFGMTPNVFALVTGEHVVGVGGKDGVYYLMNAETGALKWATKLALGGSLGGFYNGATDGKTIYLTSAIGELSDIFTATDEARQGREFALDAMTGNQKWVQYVGAPDVGQNSLIPGVYLNGSLDHFLHAWDADTGAPLWSYPVGGAISSTPVVVDGNVFVGTGTGATYRSEFVHNADPLDLTTAQMPSPIPLTEPAQGVVAFCLASDPACLGHGAIPS